LYRLACWDVGHRSHPNPQILSGIGPNLEQFLYPYPILFGQVSSARMSPLSALGFFLAIPAFLLITRGKPGKSTTTAATSLSLIVLILSGLNILGYLYGAPLFYGSTLIPVALTTAISFLFLSLGLLMTAGPSCWPISLFVGPSMKARLMRAFIPASILIVLIQGFLSSVTGPWLHPALSAALAAVVACLIVLIIISLITNNLGAEIDAASRRRRRFASPKPNYEPCSPPCTTCAGDRPRGSLSQDCSHQS